MAENSSPKRRDFLKTAAMGAAGAVGLGALRFDKAHAQTTGGWVDGMQINPAIDNKRVISCHDPKMLSSTPANTTFTVTNNAVNAAVVATNLDQMAMLLAQKTSASEAWSTIFRSSKPWASTRVAMKTNGIGGSSTNRPKWAIFKKLSDVLVGLGVQPANIVLYDACDDASTYYNSLISLTDATKIRAAPVSVRAASLGGFKAVTLANATGISAPADLVDGNIDILISVAACKSHNGTGGKYNYGSCTLCMKNHFGTFTDGAQAQFSVNLHVSNSGASPPPPPLALFEINKHPAILGGSPVRQQLCIVDALLSNGASGPGGGWDNRTDRLVMGTFAPIVDYLSAKNILTNAAVMTSTAIPALGLTNAAIILPLFLSSFGYSEATIDPWIEYDPATGVPDAGAGNGGASGSGGANGSGGKSGSGGSSGSGGAGSGGASGTGGKVSNGGASGSGGAGSGSISGGAASGGTTTAGGAPGSSGGSAGTGGTSTSVASATGGAAANGGSSAVTGKSGSTGGCDIGGLGRKATPVAALLGLGAVVAGKLRRLVIGGGDSDPKPPSDDDA
jgi:hypothetical protein